MNTKRTVAEYCKSLRLANTWEEMRDLPVPRILTRDELNQILELCDSTPANYDTGVALTVIATNAVSNYMASSKGLTGFQYSHAMLTVFAESRDLLGTPMMIIPGRDMLYPQYNLPENLLRNLNASWREWARDEAQKKLAIYNQEAEPLLKASPKVKKHWICLAAGMSWSEAHKEANTP